MGTSGREDLQETLARATRIGVLTGAGISAESGVPTFRGEDGLWRGHPPEELATPEAFRRDPAFVWEFYDWRRTLLAGCRPNPAHRALAELERVKPGTTVITQNVDGLHQQAGSERVIELHGNIWRVRCLRGCPETLDRRAPLPRPLPPRCQCGALLRPAVVWFGETLPPRALAEADRVAREAEVFLVIGTSGVVEPAASLARIAWSAGARVVEINPEPTPLSSIAHDVFREPASRVLTRLVGGLEAP